MDKKVFAWKTKKKEISKDNHKRDEIKQIMMDETRLKRKRHVERFREITGLDERTSERWLENAHFSVEKALEIFYRQMDSETSLKSDKTKIIRESADVEYRLDPSDGQMYKKNEFLEFYGGLDEWNIAVRIDRDEFDRMYAKKVQSAWRRGDDIVGLTPEDEPEEETTTKPDERRADREAALGLRTKHDPELCGRDNTETLTKHHDLHGVGDLAADRVLLSNRVYNSLRQHFQKVKKGH